MSGEQLCCPSCGSTDLGSVESIPGLAQTNGVFRTADGGIDADWTGYTETGWDGQESTGIWECQACYHHASEFELVTYQHPCIVEARDEFLAQLATLLREGDDGLQAEYVAWALDDLGHEMTYIAGLA